MDKVIKNDVGRQFVEFIPLKEADINLYQPIAGSFAIVQKGSDYLLCYNTYRNQWELPAGKREDGETFEQCALRELHEETGQNLDFMEFKGLMKVLTVAGKHQYNPVFHRKVEEIQPFIRNDETSDIMLWNKGIEIQEFDEVDLYLLNHYSFS
ncbi:NUDIX hydrolase [Rossellomorea sp. NS-SX7]|uniref:NUDIX hydrolase n=1 Tax=Rossellomorea sp. NS-SX7 TaxID=3463856 RepID=UPI004058EE56